MALTEQQRQELKQQFNIQPKAAPAGAPGAAPATGTFAERRLQELRGEQIGAPPAAASAAPIQPGVSPLRQQMPTEGVPGVKGVAVGAAKGAVSTAVGIPSLGERAVRGTLKTLLPKKAERVLGIEKPSAEVPTGAERLVPERIRTPEGTAEKVGFTIEQVAEFFAPAAKVGAITKGKGLLTRVGAQAGLFGAGEAVQEGRITPQTAISAGVGGVLPVVGRVLRPLTTIIRGLPERFVRSSLGMSKAQALRDMSRDAQKSVTKFVLNKKPIGTANSMITTANSNIEKLGEQINKNLAKIKVTQKPVSPKSIIDKVVTQVNKTGAAENAASVKVILDRLAPQARGLLGKSTMSLTNANKLRQSIDKTLGDKAFLGAQLPFNKEVLKIFTNTLREEVKSIAPAGTRGLFDDIALEIQLREFLLERLAKQAGNQVLSFGDFIGGGLGGIFGGGFGGAVAGVTARRVIESVPFKVGTGKAFQNFIQLLERLTPAQQGIILQFLRSGKKE